MAKKPLPKIDYMRKRLEYHPETGRITWRTLEPKDFPSGYTSPAMQAVDHNLHKAGHDAQTADRRGGRDLIFIAGQSFTVARVAWALHYGRWPEGIVDHIDRDPENNRIDNLRLATRAENARNRTSARGASSKYLGVSKVEGFWLAQIGTCGSIVQLGKFDSEESAALAYDCAAITFHREFANPNLIENPFLTGLRKDDTA